MQGLAAVSPELAMVDGKSGGRLAAIIYPHLLPRHLHYLAMCKGYPSPGIPELHIQAAPGTSQLAQTFCTKNFQQQAAGTKSTAGNLAWPIRTVPNQL
ncbi:hypothetical protein DSO57_1027750 [Entomophthora muscae]|uniref:Uncharacterized protein n=1 Tax=Entomophthora muscae TaxID=34485 RepID=A0ACC2UME9_9FUNG|nr:hypothetical protein DSO57_1027750 [Entomophthora muscae]